jgi:hypothetical protein
VVISRIEDVVDDTEVVIGEPPRSSEQKVLQTEVAVSPAAESLQ